jgi:serine/threonine protein kinase
MGTDTDAPAVRILGDALELPAHDRDRFIVAACAGDRELLAEVRSLLLAHEELSDDGFLETPLGSLIAGSAPDGGSSVLAIGDRVGDYELLEFLGEGGMGIVYLARQRHPERTVALKIIRPALVGRRALRRFEHEVEMLARLQHPGIAQVYGAGIPETSRGPLPYFAMEVVEGRPLTAYAAEHDLDERRRVELLALVCEAAHHAHLKGIVHRDLKPSNILVVAAPEGAHDHAGSAPIGRPKIIDFGVARLIEAGARDSMHTATGELIGTLQYMSPEQCEGDPHLTDVRSDIYTLGVVGYELMARRPPHDLADAGLVASIRRIRDESPPPLGTVVRSCRCDLETIIAKAMHRDPERRYPSASAMGADLRRYLCDTPVLARPTSRIYRLRKFARRNRPLMVAGCAALIALLAGFAATAWQWREARHSVTRLQQSLGTVASWGGEPVTSRTSGQTVRSLDNLGDIVLEGLVEDPGQRRALHEWIGNAYALCSLSERAAPHYRRCLRLFEDMDGPTAKSTLRAANLYGDAVRGAGDPWLAEEIALSALARRGFATPEEVVAADWDLDTSLGRSEALRMLKFCHQVGAALLDQGRLEDAERLLLATLRAQSLAAAGSPPAQQWDVLVSKTTIARLHVRRGRDLEEAECLFREVLEIRSARSTPSAATTSALVVDGRRDLGVTLLLRGELAEAERLLHLAERDRAFLLPIDHPGDPELACALGRLALAQGRPDEGVEHLRRAVAIGEREHSCHWRTAVHRGALGEALVALGEHEEAERHLARALADLAALGLSDEDVRVRRIERMIAASPGGA